MSYLGILLLTLLLAWAGLYLFKKWKILDKPGNDLKNTRKPIPTLQGIFVYLMVLAVLAIFHPDFFLSPLVQGFLVGGTIIVIVELFAELEYMGRIKWKFPPWFRFLMHFLAAGIALWISGLSDYSFLLWGYEFILPNRLLYLAFSIWSVFVINAVNRIDGIYAQGNGILTIGFFTIFALIQRVVFKSYTVFPPAWLDTLLLVKELALILALISLVYTFIEYKPLGLIRDVGTMFLAFWLAYLSVIGGTKIWTVVVALSLVIFDAVRVGLYRIFIAKKSPMKGDYTHLHHRLLGLGRSRGEVRAFVRIFSLVMMLLMLLQGTNRLHKVILFALMALLFFGVNAYLFLYKKMPYGLPEKKE